MACRRSAKRGVLLLVVLSVLILFVLIGVTFLVVARHYWQGAVYSGQRELTGVAPRKLLDGAMYQLLRDTRNPRCAIRNHSLLADLYGNDGFTGRALRLGRDTTGQFTVLDFDVESGFEQLVRLGFRRRERDYFSGSVLTMLSGPARGTSVRIIGSSPIDFADGKGQLILESFEPGWGERGRAPKRGRFVVNGRPLNGTGFGYDPRTGNLDLTVQLAAGVEPLRVSLLPNVDHSPQNLSVPINLGGADESWDAVDFQNVFLAMLPPTAQDSSDIIPSFHRPHLINYWRSRVERELGQPADSPLMRTVMAATVLRPSFFEHPGFTGSNPAFAAAQTINEKLNVLVNGPWDVDNDGDGVPDSVWVDLGYPDVTTTDGRLYRPLFALLCTDLDGRLNLNAHGHLGQTVTPILPRGMATGLDNEPVDPARGSGYGPPEVDLSPVLGTEAEVLVAGRYGPDGLPGVGGVDDVLSFIKNLGVPRTRGPTQPLAPGVFGSPPDFFGRNVFLLDHTGQPLTGAFMGRWDQTVDDPYELNVAQPTSTDSPYRDCELERLLRWRDVDARSLPNRLASLAPTAFSSGAGAQEHRRLVTTRSFDIPVPNMQIPASVRSTLASPGLPPSTHIVELLAARLRAAGITDPTTLDRQLRLMIPGEILQGQKMDVNRWWGNGRDDNGNLVVDEGTAIGGGEPPPTPTIPRWDPQADQYTYTYPQRLPIESARQVYARNLYCLAMLLADKNFRFLTTESLSAEQARELSARRVAQWAINAVDFRDSDAIMTPFEYDANPLNGWQEDIDGDPRTVEGGDRRLVWGCEYPELLITETAAFHDRRVKDTRYDNGDGEKRKTDAGEEGDDDLDQYRIPQGSLFIELYCTRSRYRNNPVFPPELYTVDHQDKKAALDLGRLAPRGRDGNALPVWRIAISVPHHGSGAKSPEWRRRNHADTSTFEPENMTMLPGVHEPLKVERIIWFARGPAGLRKTPEPVGIYYNRAPATALLAPARYAVVGPRPVTHIGWNQVSDAPSQQSIELARRGVRYRDLRGATRSPPGIQPATAIITAADPPETWHNQDRRIGVSVSEPLPGTDYYPEPNPTDDDRIPADAYDNPLAPKKTFPDEPLDNKRTRPLGKDHLLGTETTIDYRTAFLQRLANPLLPWNPAPLRPDGQPEPHHDARLPVNPYRTVDWMPINLTVFNGEDSKPPGWDAQDPVAIAFDPNDPVPLPHHPRFASMERGGREANVWAHSTMRSGQVPPMEGTGDYFPHNLKNTLGYLNQRLGVPLNRMADPEYNGDPAQPFPWLTWNNRPFVSHLELLLVPASSPGQLTLEIRGSSGSSHASVLDASHSEMVTDFHSPYVYLLNLFYSSLQPGNAPHYYRIFDYLEVPSRFVGTQRWYDIQVDRDANGPFLRRPPSRVSCFRDPGRVNINTVYDERIWPALVGNRFSDKYHRRWSSVVASRQRGNFDQMSSIYPTRMTNPFRSGGSADLMPRVAGLRIPHGVDATLQRSRGLSFNTADTREFNTVDTREFNTFDTRDSVRRNAYFRYGGLLRLANLLTTHSNVFAVWVTVGRFEVDAGTGRLGQELHAETGEVARHRAFYIIDRSIPVAYEPGHNHNVDRAVVVRRFIE